MKLALVITIIILLILAGIAISQLSNSGLFGKLQEAKESWDNAQEKEETKIAEYSNELENYVSNTRYNNAIIKTLWTYDSTVDGSNVNSGRATGEITLSESITNFDEIVFLAQYYENETYNNQALETRILVENITSDPPTGTANSNWKFLINLAFSTILIIPSITDILACRICPLILYV